MLAPNQDYTPLLFVTVFHDVKDDLQEILLHGRVLGGKVAGQYVLEVVHVQTVTELGLQLVGVFFVFLLDSVVLRLQLVQRASQLGRLLAVFAFHSFLPVLQGLVLRNELIACVLPLSVG